ncbi:MAG: prealbumin-like fold domain-containing protein [Oscillospiraceae bacterium]|nr:prealbumin-like fold domain-containing protein [Oscillospiraceae bacterium]
MNTINRPVFQRFVSVVLVAVLILGLLPPSPLVVTADAAATDPPATITMKSFRFDSMSYRSAYGLGSPKVHIFTANVNGNSTVAFCLNHGSYLGQSVVHDTWGNCQPWDPGEIRPFLDAFYNGMEKGTHTNSDLENAMTQSLVWLKENGKVTGKSEDQICEIVGKERVAVCKTGVWADGASYNDGANIDVGFNTELARQMIENNKSGLHGEWSYYKYVHQGGNKGHANGVQSMLIAVKKPSVQTGDKFYITFDKVDQNGNLLAGAEFAVYSDPECKTMMGESFKTEATSGKAYGPFSLPEGISEMGVYVKELFSVNGGDPSEEAATPHQVHVTKDNTKENPAIVASGKFENRSGGDDDDGDDDDDYLKKIDARTSRGVAGAVFMLRGETFQDEIPSAGGAPADPVVGMQEYFLQTDETGYAHFQWWDPHGENYIAPGQYTVTEKVPPPGYEPGPEPSEGHLVLHYDIKTKTHTSSGPLIFANYPWHTVLIEKYDESGNPLAGAVFEIYCNGTLVATETTDDSGRIYYTGGEDGAGAKTGLYRITEVEAPAGYLLPTRRTQYIYVYARDTSVYKHTVCFKNYKYPEIRIKKTENGTDKGLGGGLFEVKIDSAVIGTFTTNPGGEIVISHDVYDRFLAEGKESWTVTATELIPPDGYFMDEPRVQTAELREGEILKEFSFHDTKYPELELWKYENGTTNGLQGAIFEVAIDGQIFGTFGTDENGHIRITYEQYKSL